MTAATIPAHVPAELVRDFDYLDMGDETDVYRHFSKLHDGPDFFYTPRQGGHWVATRYADMERILENKDKAFCSYHSSLPKHPFRFPLVEMDDKPHTDLRMILAPYFTPKAIGNLEAQARELTISLIDEFYERGECEFTRDFAQKMPIIILMGVLDLPPGDRPYLLELTEQIVRGGDTPEVQQAAYGKLFQYMAEKVIPPRRAHPDKDVFSAFLAPNVDGSQKLSDEELHALGVLLIAAGLDTVASMLGFVTLHLAENPEQRQYLLDNPDRIGPALEELMRRHHLASIARMVVNDMDFNGIALKAGDMILVPTPAAGIDERRYANASTVDFGRNDNKHLVFGRGAHQCIGSFLARTELKVFLAEWLKRIPHFEVKPGASPATKVGKVVAVPYLPLVWKPTGAA